MGHKDYFLLRVSVLPDFGFDMPKTFSVMIVVVIQNFIKIGPVVSEEFGYKHTNKQKLNFIYIVDI